MPQQLNVADLTVISAAFEPHGAIPTRHSGDGEDVAPALEWTGVPPGTRAFAVSSIGVAYIQLSTTTRGAPGQVAPVMTRGMTMGRPLR